MLRFYVPLFFLLLCSSIYSADENATPEKKKPFVPCVENEKELQPLDRQDPIWVTKDRKSVVLGGEICLREGMLEFFACRTRSKEHESVIALPVKPRLIHAALLVINAKPGSPARFDPVFVPPKGEEIEVKVRWKDDQGTLHEMRAQEFVRDAHTKKEMTISWVFTGGLFGTDPDGKRYYLADISGEIIGVSNFPGSILDVPIESTADNDNLLFEPNSDKIPPIGTPVTLILTTKTSSAKK